MLGRQIIAIISVCVNKPEIMSKVICALALILENREISIAQFSKQTGLAYNTIKRLASNEFTSIDLNTIAVICDALEIFPGDLLRLKDDSGKTLISLQDLLEGLRENRMKHITNLEEEWADATGRAIGQAIQTLMAEQASINTKYRLQIVNEALTLIQAHGRLVMDVFDETS